MTCPEGGFYSALDADSEGVEGKFYVWGKEEIEAILGEDALLFNEVYNVSEPGNWEHTNILWLPNDLGICANRLQMEENTLLQKLAACKDKLMEARNKRIRPLLDDKILLGWNALMTTGCCKAYAATCQEDYLEMAEKNIVFIEQHFQDAGGTWYHTWKGGKGKYPAFLDDYAARSPATAISFTPVTIFCSTEAQTPKEEGYFIMTLSSNCNI